MTPEQAIQQLIETLLKRLPVSVSVGTVKEVDKEKRTCTVERDERPTLFNVRLNSVISDHTDHITVFPNIGSFVLCLVIGDQTDCFLLAASEIEEIAMKIDKTELEVNKSGFVFNGGSLGGMVKVSDMVSWMTKAYTDLQAISGALKGLGAPVVVTADSPNKAIFENEKVKQ